MPESPAGYDVVVLGTGSGGKIAAQQLARTGRRVLAVEDHRFGGECPYVACVPAKSLLASGQAGLDWTQAIDRREVLTDSRRDDASRQSLEDEGVSVRRGHGRITDRTADGFEVTISPGTRSVGSEPESVSVVLAPIVVLGTGSRPSVPPLDGLGDLDYWTSDQALGASDQPRRLIVLGGGAVGCELAQAFSLLGTAVTLIELADQLLPAEERWAGDALADRLRADGVTVHLGTPPQRVEKVGDETGPAIRLILDNGDVVEADRILVAGGRDPNTEKCGLDVVAACVDDSGAVEIDDRCRVLDRSGQAVPGLFAVGDVTGVSSYTHSANYQSKIVSREVTGRSAGAGPAADYRAVPRVVYTEPTVFAAGLTSGQALEQGVSVRTARIEISDVERATLLEIAANPDDPSRDDEDDARAVRGGVELIMDKQRNVLVGATCVGPEADSWGAELALAIKARIDVEVLRDHIRAFPTWSEAITAALDELAE